MIHKSFHLYSHQRSGSHYIAAVIAKNFFPGKDYLQFYKNHPTGPVIEGEIVNLPDVLFIYCWRAMEPTLRSIFKLKKRFGLKVDTYEKFLVTPYAQMWTETGERELVHFNYLKNQGIEMDISYYFRNVNRTPPDQWKAHKDWWEQMWECHPNVMLVCYDHIRDHFKDQMDLVAEKLGVPVKDHYLNIVERVGWMTAEEARTLEGRMP